MKRSSQHLDEIGNSPKRAAADGFMALKLLVTSNEISSIQGQANATVSLLQSLTGTSMSFSKENDMYPGTQLRELTITGNSQDAVLHAVTLALSQISSTSGKVPSDEADVEAGGARVKVVLPAEAGVALINGQGGSLEALQAQTGINIYVEPGLVPPGQATDYSDQVLRLAGPLTGMQAALRGIAAPVSQLGSKGWFRNWSEHSNCGSVCPGLVLFAETNAKYGRPNEDGTPGAGASSMVMKILMSYEEASVLRARGGSPMTDIMQATSTEMVLSNEGDTYPGTPLQELIVQGPSQAATVSGAVEALGKVLETRGVLDNGEGQVQPGIARLKLVLPSKAAAALIGPGGETVKQVRMHTQMHIHVETVAVPPGPLTDVSEQVVSLDGPFRSVQSVLTMICDIVAYFVTESWFAAWSAHSHSGANIPGLQLFSDHKGKGKGKGKSKGKFIDERAPAPGIPTGLTLKLLVPASEASCILGKGGTTVREIGHATGTRMTISGRDLYYPGTQLQELRIVGTTLETVMNAVAQTLSKIAEVTGSVCGGEPNVEPGGARMKVAVPSCAAPAIIGPAGQQVKHIRTMSGLHVHIEEAVVPPGPPSELSEQVVSLAGPVEGAQVAISMIAETVNHFVGEPWYDAWANHSHCGLVIPGFVLFLDGKGKAPKGKGKGKGKYDSYDRYGPSIGAAPHSNHYSGGALYSQSALAPPHSSHSDGYHSDGYHSDGYHSDGYKADPGENNSSGYFTLKLLVTMDEVNSLSQDGTGMAQIQQATGTQGILGDQCYPGTHLQELAVQGSSADGVFQAVLLMINKISDALGCMSAGDPAVEPGSAAVKLVVPRRAAAAIIGPGGQTVKQLRAETGIKLHVDMTQIPCGETLSEQALCLYGPLSGMQSAIGAVVNEVAHFVNEPWFDTWANHSNSGVVIPGLVLFDSKGKGKGAKL